MSLLEMCLSHVQHTHCPRPCCLQRLGCLGNQLLPHLGGQLQAGGLHTERENINKHQAKLLEMQLQTQNKLQKHKTENTTKTKQTTLQTQNRQHYKHKTNNITNKKQTTLQTQNNATNTKQRYKHNTPLQTQKAESVPLHACAHLLLIRDCLCNVHQVLHEASKGLG